MALRIMDSKKVRFPVQPRELVQPIQNPHRVKVYSLLKPWHPFFVFEVLKEDLNGSLSFRISVKDLESRGKKTGIEFPYAEVIGVFPWGSCPGEPSDKYEQFQLYVFECLTRLVDDILCKQTACQRSLMQLVVGQSVNWTRVCKWLELITDPLSPWFDRQTAIDDGVLRFILSQPKAEFSGKIVSGWFVRGGPLGIESWHEVLPVDIANLKTSAIEKDVQVYGDKAEAILRRHLLDGVVNALYSLRFKL